MNAQTRYLNDLRAAFKACIASAHKQIGLRALKDAAALGERNPSRVEELLARAEYHLPYALEITRRAA